MYDCVRCFAPTQCVAAIASQLQRISAGRSSGIARDTSVIRTGRAAGRSGTTPACALVAMNHSSAQQRALKILAKSVYRELKASGYARADMIAFTTELLDLVSTEAKQDQADAEAAART